MKNNDTGNDIYQLSFMTLNLKIKEVKLTSFTFNA